MVRDNKNENLFSFLKFYFVPIGIGTILLSQNHKTSADGIPYKNRFSPKRRESILVRITGLEPAWVAPHEPESCASANSAISARLNYYIKCTFKIQ